MCRFQGLPVTSKSQVTTSKKLLIINIRKQTLPGLATSFPEFNSFQPSKTSRTWKTGGPPGPEDFQDFKHTDKQDFATLLLLLGLSGGPGSNFKGSGGCLSTDVVQCIAARWPRVSSLYIYSYMNVYIYSYN